MSVLHKLLFIFMMFFSISAFAQTHPTSSPKKSIHKKIHPKKEFNKEILYDLFFNKKLSGTHQRREIFKKDGSITVHNKGIFTFKVWYFWKIKGINKTHCSYDKNGQLIRFEINSTLRGQKTKIWGTQDQKGITIHIKKKNKTTKKFFKRSLYDYTSLDFRAAVKKIGSYTHRFLLIPKLKIIVQKVSYKKAKSMKILGKIRKILILNIKSKKGKASLRISSEGWLLDSKFNIPFGKMRIKLRKISKI